jgi:hypothetical protein
MRSALLNPQAILLLLGGVAMNRKFMTEKYLNWTMNKRHLIEKNKGELHFGYAFASLSFIHLTIIKNI